MNGTDETVQDYCCICGTDKNLFKRPVKITPSKLIHTTSLTEIETIELTFYVLDELETEEAIRVVKWLSGKFGINCTNLKQGGNDATN